MDQNRRFFKRIPSKVITNCMLKQNSQNAVYFLSFTKDISVSGARLVTNKKVNSGACLELGLEIPTNFMPILVYARVVWEKDINDKEEIQRISEAGVEFLSIGIADKEKLKAFLEFKNHSDNACLR